MKTFKIGNRIYNEYIWLDAINKKRINMSIKEKIEADYKIAFKERKQEQVNTYRNIKAEILKLEKTGIVVTEADVISVLNKYANQRKESIAAFNKAGKLEQAQKEQDELYLIQVYLPSLLSEEEVQAKVQDIIKIKNYNSKKDMGKIISDFKTQYPGQADGKVLADIVKKELFLFN